jgi:hypothetical protein
MRIAEIRPQPDYTLIITATDGRIGRGDVTSYLEYEAFACLKDKGEFVKVTNGGYFIEWSCGADLSADTLEARWSLIDQTQIAAPA